MRDLSNEMIGGNINRMVIKNEYTHGEAVRIKYCAEEDDEPGFITGIMILPEGLLMYEVSRGPLYYGFELEKVI